MSGGFLGPWVQQENYSLPEGRKKLDHPGIRGRVGPRTGLDAVTERKISEGYRIAKRKLRNYDFVITGFKFSRLLFADIFICVLCLFLGKLSHFQVLCYLLSNDMKERPRTTN
jgi:hypothetical protein